MSSEETIAWENFVAEVTPKGRQVVKQFFRESLETIPYFRFRSCTNLPQISQKASDHEMNC